MSEKCRRCEGEGIYCYYSDESMLQVDECTRCKGTGYEDPTGKPNLADEHFAWRDEQFKQEYEQ